MKTETEPTSSSTQSMAQEPKSKADPALDEEDFVIVPTTDSDKKEDILNPKESLHSPNRTQPGLRNSVHRSPQLDTEPPSADHSAVMSAANGCDPNLAPVPAMEASFKGKQASIASNIDLLFRI
ncbi:hypothetical protein V6N13_123757 [Hibiscus sabdariffa]|uniref:Uncharacterized protein n=1 Tax=Hibiscus sabdariffa TaxID=183260 RepID=A0ABR2QUH5_9ROSI